jgi:acetylornithine/N-succinyldiaminopimelate aminotransferase
MKIYDHEKDALLQTYKRLPISISKAEGCYIYDDDGNKYTDFLAGIAVNALGHSDKEIIEAVSDQINKYMHVSNYFYMKPQVDLAESLKGISSLSKVFFTNSGTESMEGALKIARRWGNSKAKNEILAFSGGFHGRTYGALSIMDKPHYKNNMGPFLPNTKILEFNDTDALETNIDENTAAVVLEFLQGEGGIRIAEFSFVKKLLQLREKYDFLIIADEIQSGIGRTGRFFGYDHFGVLPDIVTLAKGMGGGLPLGAILVSEELADIFEKGMHGTTYGGNPVACRAGKVVIDRLRSGLLEDVVKNGDLLNKSLNNLRELFPELILEVRGLGLMKGLLLSFDASKLVEKLLENRIITNAASGNVLRLVPPLIITEKEIEKLYSALVKIFEDSEL